MKRLVSEKNYQKMDRNRTGRKSAISLPLNTRVGRLPTRGSVTSRNTGRKHLPTRFYHTIGTPSDPFLPHRNHEKIIFNRSSVAPHHHSPNLFKLFHVKMSFHLCTSHAVILNVHYTILIFLLTLLKRRKHRWE